MNCKKIKTFTHTIETENGKIEIRLPVKFQAIFNKICAGGGSRIDKSIYNCFVKRYIALNDFEKAMYQDIANSGKYPVETAEDLSRIFGLIRYYYTINNVKTYEDLGKQYVLINRFEHGELEKIDSNKKYAELGKNFYQSVNGFFANGRFYVNTIGNQEREEN